MIPDEDLEEVDRRAAAFEAELNPKTSLAVELVKRVALLTVRLNRSAEHEARAISHRMRNAVAAFDDARLAEAERLHAWIAAEPVTNARRLRNSPEGLARLIAAIEALRADLATPGGYRWGYEHNEQLHNLLGLRSAELPVSRARALTDAIAGNFRHLAPTDGEGLETNDRRVWAIGQLVYFMDDQVAALKQQLESFDRSSLDLDRAEAPSRAIFDASTESILARKYEAANERALFRTLGELREIQADASEIQSRKDVAHESAEELGSFCPEPPEGTLSVADVDPLPANPGQSTFTKRPNLEKLARRGRKRSKTT